MDFALEQLVPWREMRELVWESSAISPSTRLERRRTVDLAWQQFVQEGIEPAGVSEEISLSWRRARDFYRIDPTVRHPTRALAPDALEERRRRDEVLRFASPILREFSDRMRLADHVLSYFDAEGWMLAIDGDRRIADRLEEIHFCAGTNWTEESAGTNGPGTALATGKSIEVFASEHFVSAWQPWSCAAAPILLPGSATPVGVIDVTGPWEVRRRQALLVVNAIARAVEERIRAAFGVRAEVIRHTFRSAQESGDALVAVDSRCQVIALNDAAARRRVVEGGALSGGMRDALVQVLRSHLSDADVRLELPDGPAAVASTVRYEGSTVGAILRVHSNGGPAVSRRPRAPARPSARYDLGCIQGESQPLRQALALARTASRNELSVLLCGESGTGKELFAQGIHFASARKEGPFVALNCGCIPAQLVEAELFGYEAGTFTGAKREGNPGRCEDAEGGTLFLDEVSELPLAAQTALLRVLQEKEVVRLGGSTPRPVNVRIVAATNKPLKDEILAKRFRSDLYYRLNVFSISVPPLRDRIGDIPFLAQAFLAEAEAEVGRSGLTLSPDAIAALEAHSWGGNVRELKNVLLRAAATAPCSSITANDLLLEEGAPEPPEATASASSNCELKAAMGKLERDALLSALEANDWNLARASRQLGTSRMTLYRWMSKHGIERKPAGR